MKKSTVKIVDLIALGISLACNGFLAKQYFDVTRKTNVYEIDPEDEEWLRNEGVLKDKK